MVRHTCLQSAALANLYLFRGVFLVQGRAL